MNLEPYWRAYDATLARVRDEKPDTFQSLTAILDQFEPPSSGDAFFGDGADDQLADALHDAGWHVHYIEATYLYTARHRTTGARLRYVEGDVFDETPEHKPVQRCPECRDGKCHNCTGWALDADDNMTDCPCSHVATDNIDADNIDADPTLDNPNFIEETNR